VKTRWTEMNNINKFMFAARIVISVAVIILASLQLLRIWEKALALAMPLIGVELTLQSIQEWKDHRKVAIFGLCAAGFIFACAIVVYSLQ